MHSRSTRAWSGLLNRCQTTQYWQASLWRKQHQVQNQGNGREYSYADATGQKEGAAYPATAGGLVPGASPLVKQLAEHTQGAGARGRPVR